MLNNLINIHDFVVLARRIRQKGMFKALHRVFKPYASRVQTAWEHTESKPINWWDIPEVQKRWNYKITGNPDLEKYEYVAQKYLRQNSNNLRGLSIGCGTGISEVKWARTNIFRKLEAFDISEERISHAQSLAKKERMASCMSFYKADAQKVAFHQNSLDVAIAEGILHHLAPVESIVAKVHQWLKPGGFFVVTEYVGPSRFQWTKKQLDLVNAILTLLPEKFRRQCDTNEIKKRVYRPGRLSMYLNDPSEASESAKILSALTRYFEILERKDFGGTILQLLFKDIAMNFMNPSEECMKMIQLCFFLEDCLIEAKEIESDFTFLVCKKL
jgi:ubiquinone/menaquinone biosynthesis C-methylase UbiE